MGFAEDFYAAKKTFKKGLVEKKLFFFKLKVP